MPTHTVRRATPQDASLLAEHRAAVWHEVGEWSLAELAPQIPVWTAFFAGSVRDATYVAFVAEEANETLGSGAVLVHAAIPRPGLVSDRAGRVQSLYIVPHARGRGIARAIMERLVLYARETKLIALSLHPSDEARPLYASLGFEQANEMRLEFVRG